MLWRGKQQGTGAALGGRGRGFEQHRVGKASLGKSHCSKDLEGVQTAASPAGMGGRGLQVEETAVLGDSQGPSWLVWRLVDVASQEQSQAREVRAERGGLTQQGLRGHPWGFELYSEQPESQQRAFGLGTYIVKNQTGGGGEELGELLGGRR